MIVEEHPLLGLQTLEAEFPEGLSAASPSGLVESLRLGSESPFVVSEEVKSPVRDLLRHGGFKPSGRNKPASEYLIKASEKGFLSSINVAVDICNVVSLHSGIPISVVDLDLVQGDPRVAIAAQGESYVFNASGQVLDIGGLICLFDADGACANAVKDSHRTKTSPETTRVLYLFWAPIVLEKRAETALEWMRKWLTVSGAEQLGG